jgi:quercetin dioxygenase-like cupin family protein
VSRFAKEVSVRNRLAVVALVAVGFGTQGSAQDAKQPGHVLLKPAEAKWGDPPPALPKGAQFLLVSGDPGKPGPFAIRIKMPAGYKIAPHFHPTDEHVTVLAGTFSMGMGEKFDAAALTDLPAGGYGLMPAQMRHFATAKTAATIQVHGTGPFSLTYVNAADDPRNAATK